MAIDGIRTCVFYAHSDERWCEEESVKAALSVRDSTIAQLRAELAAMTVDRDFYMAERDKWYASHSILTSANERLEGALRNIDVAFANTDYSDRDSEDHFERIRDIALAALSPTRDGGGDVMKNTHNHS